MPWLHTASSRCFFPLVWLSQEWSCYPPCVHLSAVPTKGIQQCCCHAMSSSKMSPQLFYPSRHSAIHSPTAPSVNARVGLVLSDHSQRVSTHLDHYFVVVTLINVTCLAFHFQYFVIGLRHYIVVRHLDLQIFFLFQYFCLLIFRSFRYFDDDHELVVFFPYSFRCLSGHHNFCVGFHTVMTLV